MPRHIKTNEWIIEPYIVTVPTVSWHYFRFNNIDIIGELAENTKQYECVLCERVCRRDAGIICARWRDKNHEQIPSRCGRVPIVWREAPSRARWAHTSYAESPSNYIWQNDDKFENITVFSNK